MTPERWEEISRVYYAALKVAEKERTVFIAEACNQDAELRKEVESLLAKHGQAEDMLSKPAGEDVKQAVMAR